MAKNPSLKEYFSSGVNKKRWEEAKARIAAGGGGFEEYDDGSYRVKVVSAKVAQSQSGYLQHVIGFKFMEGDYKGKQVFQYQRIENDTGLDILLGTLGKLGYEVEDPDDVENIDKKLSKLQPEVMLRLSTKGEYQNKNVIKLLEEADSSDGDADEDEEESEEKDESDDNDTDESEESAEETEDNDDDDDEDGEEETEKEDSEDDEDAEEKPKAKVKNKPAPVEEEDEKVELNVGMRVKAQIKNEVVKAKVVKIDEEEKRIKVKLPDGEKVWIKATDIVDLI